MREIVDTRFEERQSFGPLFNAVFGIAVFGIAVAEVAARGQGKLDNLWIDFVIGVPFLLFLANVSRLTTYVTDEYVQVRYGVWIPFFWKRFPLASITGVRAITYRPLRDAGGWGIRLGRFEGTVLWFYNARGNRGVLLEMNGKPCVIGSQQPEDLVAAIVSVVRERKGRTL